MRCVHCLKETIELTEDHVFPISWYPSNFPKDIEKITVPSCKQCNNTLGKIEEDLRLKISLTFDPKHSELKNVLDKAKRSIQPYHGKNEKDTLLRAQKRKKLLEKDIIEIINPNTQQGILPNFGRDPSIVYDKYTGVLLPEELLNKFAEKIIRGMTYYLYDKLYIEDDYKIDIFYPKDEEVKLLLQNGREYNIPGFNVMSKNTAEDQCTILFRVSIWDKLVFYASVLKNNQK